VVPIISASVSWLILAMTGSILPSFPKLAINSSNRFLIKEVHVVDQVRAFGDC
jgi:hypothetical protein